MDKEYKQEGDIKKKKKTNGLNSVEKNNQTRV